MWRCRRSFGRRLTGVWLTAMALWLVGGLLRCAARPRAGRARMAAGVGRPPVSAQRIEEWEGAWRRALRFQESGEPAGGVRPAALAREPPA